MGRVPEKQGSKVKKKQPWISASERKRMEQLARDIERCMVFYPHREEEYSAQLRNLQRELEFDK